MTSWAERTWLITGGSSGIGRCLAAQVLEQGGRVVVTARDASRIDLDLKDRGAAVSLDLTCPDTIPAAVAAATEAVGAIDVLVNNAGYGLIGAIEETSDDERRAQFEANFFGPTWLTTLLLPKLRERERSMVVNVSSVSAIAGSAGSGYYAASKSALELWSDALRAEVKPFGVHVMVVQPGGFRTGFFGSDRAARPMAANQLGIYPAVDARRRDEGAFGASASGDPERGARVIIEALDADTPPDRLPLSAQSTDIIDSVLRSRVDEVEGLRAVSASADYPS